MKIFKRILSILIISAFVFSLCACGGNDSKKDKKSSSKTEEKSTSSTKEAKSVWYLGKNQGLSNEIDVKKLFKNVKDTITPSKIYESVSYKEDMLYGAYGLSDTEKDIKSFQKNTSFKKVEFTDGKYELSCLPYEVYSGKDDICSSGTNYSFGEYKEITDREVAVLKFVQKDGKYGMAPFMYEVNGNKVKYTEIEQTSKSGEKFAYKIGKAVYEYEFSFEGPYLTLKSGEDSVRLVSYCFSADFNGKLEMTGYSLLNTPLIDELDYCYSTEDSFNYAVKRDGSYYSGAAYRLNDNGIITVYLTSKDNDGNTVKFVKQYAYIAQSHHSIMPDFGIILLDGEKSYYYTDSISEREARILKDSGTDTSKLTDDEIKEIAEKKSDLFDELYKEFSSKGINVTINRSTGEMAMDATVLFGGDSAVITDGGKQLLNKFLEVYTKVALGDKFKGFIQKTLIEGHTAPVSGSTYESGLPLSVERANNVKNYCLSAETGVDVSKLATTLDAAGCSNSKPVYDMNGNVDMAASRRVSFRFIVNISK